MESSMSQVSTPYFEAAMLFARTEGIVAGPEPAHAIRHVVNEAVRCREAGESKAILFNLSGHGHFDLAAYEQHLAGKLPDFEYPEEEIRRAVAELAPLQPA
jgi:tryptophan synthase beta chain